MCIGRVFTANWNNSAVRVFTYPRLSTKSAKYILEPKTTLAAPVPSIVTSFFAIVWCYVSYRVIKRLINCLNYNLLTVSHHI